MTRRDHPHGEDCFRAGDSVIIVSKQKLKDLEDILAGRP